MEKLDDKTMCKIIIDDATFLKDGDTFGKQDPYVKFNFGNLTLQTDVIDNGGLYAKFDAVFLVPDIITLKEQSIVFQTYDKDAFSSDLLGETDPVDIIDILDDDKVHYFELEIFEDNGQPNGKVKLSTQLILKKPDPPANPDLNCNC